MMKNKSKQAIFKPNSNKGVLKHIAIWFITNAPKYTKCLPIFLDVA